MYFTGWEGKSLDEILNLVRDVVEDPSYPTVKAWRMNGGKVLGHFQVYFPEELAHAAGLLPVKIRGAQTDGNESESHFGSYLCSIIKTSLDVALSKNVELDLFVTHPICDAARNLASVWGRNFDYKCQILYLPQNPTSKDTLEYLTHEYRRVLSDVEAVAGRKVADVEIRAAIDLYDRSRALMRELYAIRKASPWLLGADESAALVGLAGLVPRQEWISFIEFLIPMIKGRPTRQQERMRVVIEGGFCETPPFDMLQTIARSCYVVDDDVLIGMRFLVKDVRKGKDPVEDLAEAYLDRSSYSPVQHDHRKPKEKMLLERIKHSGAELVILASAKMCEPGLEEQVAYAKELEKAGIPYFVSEFEENQNTFDQLAVQLETFVENLMFD
jgi:benzoyl-CoA reductase subunit C